MIRNNCLYTPETGYVVKNIFDNRGALVKVTQSNGTVIWELKDVSSHGLPVQTTMGNGLTTNYGYTTDQLTSITTGTVQNETYTVDHPNIGNLLSRTDIITGQSESFVYDNLDRLTKIYPVTPPVQNITYTGNGNIITKSFGGTYDYDGIKVHAVTSVTKTAGTNRQDIQDITYTSFNKAATIQQWTPVTNKPLSYAITYGPDEQRVKTIYIDTLGAKTYRFYAGNYEKDSVVITPVHKVVSKIHYIMGGTGIVAAYIVKSSGQANMYYVCTDRQGSITALLNQDKTVAEKYSYDAWGRRRNPTNWNDYNVPAPNLIARGYTGHEHLDGFGLINMNGRMYDPVIGRVLSPDAFVQAPGYTQSYNRYSYCMNNPLRYTDPSGWLTQDAYNQAMYTWNNLQNTSFSDGVYSWFDGAGGGGGFSFSASPGDAYNMLADYNNEYDSWGNTLYPNGATVVEHSYLNGETTHVSKTTGWTVESHDAVWYSFEGKQTDPLSSGLFFPYSNENAAYRVMWALSHADISGKDKSGNNWYTESFGIITNKGVLVLPNAGMINGSFYANSYDMCKFAEAWLVENVENRMIKGTQLQVIATIHTHPEIGTDGFPYDQYPSGKDLSTMYTYGNMYTFNSTGVYVGYRTSGVSDTQRSYTGHSFKNIITNLSINKFNLTLPYYPY